MLANMTADQFWDWQAYYRIEPWGLENRNAAMQMALIANMVRSSDDDPVGADAFMPQFETQEIREQADLKEKERILKQKLREMQSGKK